MALLMTILTGQVLSDVAHMSQFASIISTVTIFDTVRHCGHYNVDTFILMSHILGIQTYEQNLI